MKTRTQVTAVAAALTAVVLLATAWLGGYDFDYRSSSVAEVFLLSTIVEGVVIAFAAGWPVDYEDEKNA